MNTPVQLNWTAAVLIREGLVALDDLYPHLDPVDDSSVKKEMFEYLSGLQKNASKAGRFAPTKVCRISIKMKDGPLTSNAIYYR